MIDETCIKSGSKLYYLDAVNGNDGFDGSKLKPFKTTAKAMLVLSGGDTVLMASGNYGVFAAAFSGTINQNWTQKPVDVFSDWVTFKALKNNTPVFDSLNIGTWRDENGNDLPFSTKGNANAYLVFDGVKVRDTVKIFGARHIKIVNSAVSQGSPAVASADQATCRELFKNTSYVDQCELVNNMQDACVTVYNGTDVTLENNNISHCTFGIKGMTTDFKVLRNEIHNGTQDGISCHGGDNWLIEGNKIHDNDDGASDAEQSSGAKPYNMHVDGIHCFVIGGATPENKYAYEHKNFTIRGNLIYHQEGQAIILSLNLATGVDSRGAAYQGYYHNFVVENNIFGPAGGTLLVLGNDFLEGFVLRHNTVLEVPNDAWTSIFGRAMTNDPAIHPYQFLWNYPSSSNPITANSTPEFIAAHYAMSAHYEVYNNIFVGKIILPSDFGLVANNLYKGTTSSTAANGDRTVTTMPYYSITGTLNDYIVSGNTPGKLKSNDASAINAGILGGTATDFLGMPRDSQPDIGALEFR